MFRWRGDRRAGNSDRSIQVECLDSSKYQFTLEVSGVARNMILLIRSFVWLLYRKD